MEAWEAREVWEAWEVREVWEVRTWMPTAHLLVEGILISRNMSRYVELGKGPVSPPMIMFSTGLRPPRRACTGHAW
mgnify:CR=1 FL=1